MSIFFEFEVGPTGRRFRRAVDADKYDIALIHKHEHTEPLFGEVDLGSLIELSVLSICLIDDCKKVTGFLSLSDYPNVPSIDPGNWEVWMRNMFQKYYLSRNTLFFHFMCCIDEVTPFFLEEALVAIFLNDMYLHHIVIMVPPGCPTSIIKRYKRFNRRTIFKLSAKRDDDSIDRNHYMYVAERTEFVPKLKIRRAVEEDNDDIIEILDKKCPKLKELYGEYYVSEIVGRHPEARRKIIVAEFKEHAIGLMCLNPNVNYNMLQETYELQPYHGLIKATSIEKEESKRKNTLLKAFGEPITTGQWSPFHSLKKLEQLDSHTTHEEPLKEKYNTLRRKSSKLALAHVNFISNANMRRSFDQLYIRQHNSDSDFEIDKSHRTTPLMSWTDTVTSALLDDDPFEYDIINIESKLFAVPEPLSFESMSKPHITSSAPATPLYTAPRRKSSSIVIRGLSQTNLQEEIVTTHYTGESNAFIIELFGLRDDFDQRQAFDLLEAAFEVMKTMDYCIIRVPSVEKCFPLLQHFCFVPTKSNVCSQYALYIAHRSSVLGKFRVRRAELFDIPQIAIFLHNIEGRETVWTIESCIVNKYQHSAYVFFSGMALVGVGIVEPPDHIDFIRAKFNLDAFHNHKYHLREHGHLAGFCNLTAVLVYPIFEAHYRFFARELMRLTDSQCLIWLTAYRNKLVAHKANTIASAMIPIMPRKSEIDCVRVPELKPFNSIARDVMAFSTWFLNKKLTSVTKVNIDTRILIVGASTTAMGFLDNLLFSDATSYLTFTNVTLISKHGLSYVRNTKVAAQEMFLKFRTDTDKYLKTVPYTYYVNVVQGRMVDINKKMKYIKLANGSTYDYDMLFLLFGKQYQHPDYLKVVFEREKEIRSGTASCYTRLDQPSVPKIEDEIFNLEVPENVFLVNDIAIANKALNYVHHILWIDSNYKIIVYGETIHAYCCLNALLEDGVLPEHLIFVEPFPPENPKRTRIPVFCNLYVDQTICEVLANSGVTVYRSYYFDSWTVKNDVVTHVDFISDFHRLRLECSTFFYYGKRGVDLDGFVAINKSGMAYDGGILIDHNFRTKDHHIYAAGPSTRYYRKYYADSKRQKYYDSYEVGAKLGTQIRNQLDPLLIEINSDSNCGRESDQFQKTSFASAADSSSSKTGDERPSSQLLYKPPEGKLPEFKKPLVMHCNLPGGLQYLEVRPPGKKIPHHYIQSLQFNGFVLETFKKGYFKIRLNEDLFVDGITCLTTEKYNLDNFKNLYGLSAVVLNNVHLRYGAKKIDNFFTFFRSPWAFFLYHEHRDELFATIKEILPKGCNAGVTLREALTSVSNRISDPSYRQTTKFNMRNSFEKSPYVESITAFVIEWLSENDILLPMYMQPWQGAEYQHDIRRNVVFKKKKQRFKIMLSKLEEG